MTAMAGAKEAVSRAALVWVVAALAWLALTGGDGASFVVGIPVVLLAGGAAVRVRGGGAATGWPKARALMAYGARLLWDVFASAWSLALRVLRPRMEVDPVVLHHRVSLQSPAARAAFMNAVTLTPGTLAADLVGDLLAVHSLDRRDAVLADLAALEARTARIFADETVGREPLLTEPALKEAA